MGDYNPHAPLVVGNEYAPVLQSNYRPDLFVERGYSFLRGSDDAYGWASMFVQVPPPWPVPGHAYLWTLYARGQETATGPMQTVTIPLPGLDASTNTLNEDGTATAANRIQAIGDANYIRFRTTSTGESYIRLQAGSLANDPFELVDNQRVVDVSILYTASAQNGNEAPVPFEINLYNVTRSQRVSYGNAEVDLRPSFITGIRRSRWGEIATWVHATADAFTEDTSRYPWNYNQLSNFCNTGNGQEWAVEFRTASAAQDGPREINLHYAAMQVTYCAENRYAVAGLVRGSDYIDPDQTFVPDFSGYLFGRNTQNQYGKGFIVPNTLSGDAANWAVPGGNTNPGTLTLTLKRADYGPYNNQGEPPLLRALRTVDVFPGHPGIVITNTIESGQAPVSEVTDLLPQIVPHRQPELGENGWELPAVAASHVYGQQFPIPVFDGNPASQDIVQNSDGTAVEYPQLRFWARYQTAPTAPLRVSIDTLVQPLVEIAQLSVAEVDAFPEIADGWHEVTIPVDPALLVDDDGTVIGWGAPRWDSSTSSVRVWEILGAQVINYATDFPTTNRSYNPAAPTETGIGTYGDDDAQGRWENFTSRPDADLDVSVAWGQAMPAIAGLAVSSQTQPVAVVDPDCPLPLACIPDGIEFLRVTWTPIEGGYEFVGLGNYEVQRQDDTMEEDAWETVFSPIHPLVDTFDDYEARVGVPTRYRIRYVHQNGMAGPWSAEVESELLLGVTGVGASRGVLIFTSNVDPSQNLAYVQIWNGTPSEEFGFVEAATRELQRMYGRDYQVAFRPLERGGVQFTRTLLVNAVTIPVETLEEGFTSLRDLAWADLPYVAVRSDRGDRWLSNVNVPSGTIRQKRKLYQAEVEITEVSDVPFAPEPGHCEGMVARGFLPSTVYEPRFATTQQRAELDTDDADVRVLMRLDQFGQVFPLMAQYYQYTANGWLLATQLDGGLWWRVRDSPLETSVISDPVPFLPGDLFWVRVVYDMDGGGATSTTQFYTSVDGVTWGPLATALVEGNDSVSVGTAADDNPLTVGSTFDGSADLGALVANTGGSGGWNGVISEAQFIGDGGIVLASPDFEAQEPETTQFEDAQGNIWSVFGGVCTVDRRL